ncbi:MAG: hypothetical protein SR1Q7_06795 [Quinella sp. 1Q7]|nr:hypothetical protein [Quinella sp. 1Q7]
MQNKLMHYKKKMVRQVHGKKIRRTLYPPTKNFPPQTLNISARRSQKNRRTLYPPTKFLSPQIGTFHRDGRKKIDGRLPADKIFIAVTSPTS